MEHFFKMHPLIINIRAARRAAARISVENERSRVRGAYARQLARRRRVWSLTFEDFEDEIASPWVATILVVDEDIWMDLRFAFLALAFLTNGGQRTWIPVGGEIDAHFRMRDVIDLGYGPFEDLFEKVVNDEFWY